MHAIVCRSTEALFLLLRLYRLAAIAIRAVILINEAHVFSTISFGYCCSSFGCLGFAISWWSSLVGIREFRVLTSALLWWVNIGVLIRWKNLLGLVQNLLDFLEAAISVRLFIVHILTLEEPDEVFLWSHSLLLSIYVHLVLLELFNESCSLLLLFIRCRLRRPFGTSLQSQFSVRFLMLINYLVVVKWCLNQFISFLASLSICGDMLIWLLLLWLWCWMELCTFEAFSRVEIFLTKLEFHQLIRLFINENIDFNLVLCCLAWRLNQLFNEINISFICGFNTQIWKSCNLNSVLKIHWFLLIIGKSFNLSGMLNMFIITKLSLFLYTVVNLIEILNDQLMLRIDIVQVFLMFHHFTVLNVWNWIDCSSHLV